MPHVLIVTPPHGTGVVPSAPPSRSLVPAMQSGGFTVEHCLHPEHLPRRLRVAPPSAIVLPLRPGAAPAAEATIREVRALCPEVPLVVYCVPSPDGAAVLAAARAGARHFAFAPADDLTRILQGVIAPAHRISQERQIVETRLAGIPSLARRVLVAAMSHDPPLTKVPSLARALGVRTRTLRRALARRGWPPPKTMLDAGRTLRTLVALADGEHPSVAAAAGGFASARAVPRALRRLLAMGGLTRERGRPLGSQLPRLLDVLERATSERTMAGAAARGAA